MKQIFRIIMNDSAVVHKAKELQALVDAISRERRIEKAKVRRQMADSLGFKGHLRKLILLPKRVGQRRDKGETEKWITKDIGRRPKSLRRPRA